MLSILNKVKMLLIGNKINIHMIANQINMHLIEVFAKFRMGQLLGINFLQGIFRISYEAHSH